MTLYLLSVVQHLSLHLSHLDFSNVRQAYTCQPSACCMVLLRVVTYCPGLATYTALPWAVGMQLVRPDSRQWHVGCFGSCLFCILLDKVSNDDITPTQSQF